MPENVTTTQTCGDSDGVTKQEAGSVHPSVWMAHWMSTSSNSCKLVTKPACSRQSVCPGSLEEVNRVVVVGGGGEGLEEAGNNESLEECEKRSSEAAETKLVRAADEKSKSLFPMFNLQRKGDESSGRKDERPSTSSLRESTKPGTEQGDTGFRLYSQGGNEKHLKDLPPMLQWVHGAKSLPRENPVSADKDEGIDERSVKGEFVVSSSRGVPYGFNIGRATASPISKQEDINQPNSNAMFLAHDKTLSKPFERSRNPSANDEQLLPRDPSTSITQRLEMQEVSHDRLSPSKSNPVDLIGSEKYRGCLSLPSPPCRLHDMEAIKAQITIDSAEESSRVQKQFPTSTAHRFLLTGSQMPRESMMSIKLKERYFSESFRFDQDVAFPMKSRVKLRLLGSSTESERERDAEEFKTSSVDIRNESSSETNTMDVDTFRKSHVSGVVSSSSKKQIDLENPTRTAQDAEDSSATEMRKRKFPDINQQPNELVACPSSADTSTSRTQSLDVEHLLSYAEQPTLKFTVPAGCSELEASRWVKRLKKSPASGCATRSLKMGEDDSSHEKVNTMFSKVMKFSLIGSDPTTSRLRPRELAGVTQMRILPSNRTPSVDSARRNHEVVTLSHPWVRRLCLNAAVSSSEKSKTAKFSESQRSTENLSEKKQFPSLGAMALMGKALRGYHRTCQFKKKGSSLVWSS